METLDEVETTPSYRSAADQEDRDLLLPYASRPPVIAHTPLKCWVLYLQYVVAFPKRVPGHVR